MQTEIRFTCPECGQHYTAEAGWQGLPLTCSACQARFEVRSLPALAGPETTPPAMPAARVRVRLGIPSRPRREESYQLLGTFYGLVTPLALATIAFVCLYPLSFLGQLGMLLGYLGGAVGTVYVSNRFAKWYLATRGRDALEYYRKSASTAFLLVPAVAVVVFLSLAEEGAGLFLFPLTFGFYFVSIMLAAAWLIGAKWFGPGN